MAFSEQEMSCILERLRGGETVTASECSNRYLTTFAWRDDGWVLDCFEEGVTRVVKLNEEQMRAEIDRSKRDIFAPLLRPQPSKK